MMILGYLSFLVLIVLIVLGIPIGLSLIAIGVVGLVLVGEVSTAMTQTTIVLWSEGTKFILIALPFYIMMGNLVYRTGIARNIFMTASYWLGWLPGGLAIASVFACAGFGAVSGSSTATARTMGAIVIPEMRRHGYSMQLASGVLSSSGTLGILIPPSIILIFYGLMTETSIGDLFVAGIIPGLCIAVLFSVIVMASAMIWPESAGGKTVAATVSWRERFVSLLSVLPVLAIFAFILAGLYLGVFTPTEAAVFGVVAVLVYGAIARNLPIAAIRDALLDSVLTTAMLYLIIVGGTLYTRFLAQTGMIADLENLVIAMDLSYFSFILVITLIYLALGCVLDLFGMLILTVPILFPIATQLGIDPVWFGIYIVVVAEVGLITPPVGVNVYVIYAVAKDVPLGRIFLGCVPFVLGMLFFIACMAVFPEIVLTLVH
ncbi:hypothetical protein CBW24_16105 (plasmid) [Pacificitalea manganoxidans]|uniref:TRAP transporter large permease protein n=1 Tax=Pacificitalea manganoxidans TaxID=1411902 RepID=A0A291M435_9RHOB|nr:TRAP transporter large permease [Pacificitalea manganoxidans]ATI43679.1 hypothetical protein CBW24_16105 [Pacificitalea manganoxidans]MDR6310073.1 tripartite ATP-independent transporter DctM subunit [Pacificitalea manganoxidans]